MSREVDRGHERETRRHSNLGQGVFIRGKWCCECGQNARWVTTKKAGPNKGSKCKSFAAPILVQQKLTRVQFGDAQSQRPNNAASFYGWNVKTLQKHG
jgi:hypothetical protein